MSDKTIEVGDVYDFCIYDNGEYDNSVWQVLDIDNNYITMYNPHFNNGSSKRMLLENIDLSNSNIIDRKTDHNFWRKYSDWDDILTPLIKH